MRTQTELALNVLAPVLPSPFQLDGLQGELELGLGPVVDELLAAKAQGRSLRELVAHPERAPAVAALHTALRDALFVELPGELAGWAHATLEGRDDASARALARFGERLVGLAGAGRHGAPQTADEAGAAALAELLTFESVRLRLLVAAWSSDEFEALGGDESLIDAVAAYEVERGLDEPALFADEVRPMAVLTAAAAVSLARQSKVHAASLRWAHADTVEELRMRARLRAALRELRLAEMVLLENALANLLGLDRIDVTELQARHPLALEGLSRQTLDQRVSRGRRALTGARERWPARKGPALFDLLRRPQGPATGDRPH